MKKIYRDEIWDFRKANTKKYTHCFHQYPAMMIPQVAGKILDEFGKNAKLLFDPYCGTGTSLVEANIREVDAIGTDINPLARLIAKAKTTIISLETLDLYLKNFNDFTSNINLGVIKVNPVIPDFKNIDYWFKKETQSTLALIKKYIEGIDNLNIQNFFKVAFSETIREASLTRNSEFKLYRVSKEKIEKFNPDVFSIMISRLFRNRNGMEEYILLKNKDNIKSLIYDFNTVFEIPEKILSPESVDIIMTSPPYGDSRTTVAYGQFSRLSNQWLDIENANEIDKKLMGGKRSKDYIDFGFEPLDKALKEISKKDEKRVYDVISFYIDYRQSIQNISKVVRKNGIAAFVIGNRRVKGIEIPNDEITKAFFEENGFKHIKTIIRKIPNKRMPKRNSPSNVAGITETTMNYEYILILKKENL